MKTPHTIELYFDEATEPQYDPVTDSYISDTESPVIVPCFANYISQAKVFELYGSETERVLIARFMQEQPPFVKARIFGKLFRPVDSIDAPVKGAVRMKEVAE